MTVIGEAFVEILPATEGFIGEAESKLKGLMSGLAGPVALAGAGVTGVIAGVAALGNKFEDAFHKIAVGTGQTGAALAGLDESFKTVLGTTSGSMDQVATAITQIADRTGLSGAALDDFAAKETNLAVITKSDLATTIDATTGLMNKFGIAAIDQSAQLDVLYNASQRSGVSVATLASDMNTIEPIARIIGFTFNQTAALVSNFEKANVPAAQATSGLRVAVAQLTKEGIPAQQGLKDMVAALKNTNDPTAAAALALHDFGLRAGPQMLQAVQSGKFGIDELTASLAGNTDSIDKAAEHNATMGESLDKLRNVFEVDLEPVATKVIAAITKGVSDLAADMGKPAFKNFITDMTNLAKKMSGDVQTALKEIAPVVEAAVKQFVAFTQWITDHKQQISDLATVVAAVLTPAMIALGVKSTISAAAQVAAWVSTEAAALISRTGQLISLSLVTAGWIETALQAGISAASQAIAWFTVGAAAFGAEVLTSGSVAAMISKWILLGAQGYLAAGRAAAAWALSAGSAAVTAVTETALAVGKMIASWVLMGARALLHAAEVVSAWALSAGKAMLDAVVAVGSSVATVVAGWALMGAQALWHAGEMAAGWVLSVIGAIPAVVAMGAAALSIAAEWVGMAATATVSAVAMAAAWVLAFWPIALIVVSVVGLAVVIYENWDKIKRWTLEAWDAVSGFIKSAWDTISGDVWNAIMGVVHFFEGLGDMILGALRGFDSLLSGIGGDLMNGLKHGITAAWHFVTDELKRLVDLLPDPLKKAMGISSPSTVFAGFGKNLMEGLALGINSNAHLPNSALATALGGLSATGGIAGRLGAIGGANMNIHIAAPGATPATVAQLRSVAQNEIAAAFRGVVQSTAAGTGTA